MEGDQVCQCPVKKGQVCQLTSPWGIGCTDEASAHQSCSPQREYLAERYFQGLAPGQSSSPYTNSKGPLSTSLQIMKNDPGILLPPKGVHNGFSTGPLDAEEAGTSTLGMLN